MKVELETLNRVGKVDVVFGGVEYGVEYQLVNIHGTINVHGSYAAHSVHKYEVHVDYDEDITVVGIVRQGYNVSSVDEVSAAIIVSALFGLDADALEREVVVTNEFYGDSYIVLSC